MEQAVEALVRAMVESALSGLGFGMLIGGAVGLAVGIGALWWLRRSDTPNIARTGLLGVVSVVVVPIGLAITGASMGGGALATMGMSRAVQAHDEGVQAFALAGADAVGGLAVVGGSDLDLAAWVRGEVLADRAAMESGVRSAIRRLPADDPDPLAAALSEAGGETLTRSEMLRVSTGAGALVALVQGGDLRLSDVLPSDGRVVDRLELAQRIRRQVVDVALSRVQLAGLGVSLVVGGFGLSVALLPLILFRLSRRRPANRE